MRHRMAPTSTGTRRTDTGGSTSPQVWPISCNAPCDARHCTADHRTLPFHSCPPTAAAMSASIQLSHARLPGCIERVSLRTSCLSQVVGPTLRPVRTRSHRSRVGEPCRAPACRSRSSQSRVSEGRRRATKGTELCQRAVCSQVRVTHPFSHSVCGATVEGYGARRMARASSTSYSRRRVVVTSCGARPCVWGACVGSR